MICDLFGLMLFGPGFAAAHNVYLRPMHANPYGLGLSDLTHPPYATRQRLLVRAMQLIGWDQPVATDTECRKAEEELLRNISLDQYDGWATVFSDQQLTQALSGVRKVLADFGGLSYLSPDAATLCELVSRLKRRLPPIRAELSGTGKPKLYKVEIAHTLYAGWVYWFGNRHLTREPLSFLDTNKLCDHALLQQGAINVALAKKLK